MSWRFAQDKIIYEQLLISANEARQSFNIHSDDVKTDLRAFPKILTRISDIDRT